MGGSGPWSAEMGMDKRAAALVNHSFKQPRTMDLAPGGLAGRETADSKSTDKTGRPSR